MLHVGQNYMLGDVEHTFPALKMSGKFKYSSKAKEIHRRLLLLLDDFDTVCELQDIQYTIGGKTLLGSIRHGGFIPWEPNAEVEMLEADALQLEKIYASPSEWYLTKTDFGYRIKEKGGSDEPYLEVVLTTYSKLLHKYVFVDPSLKEAFPLYESLYAELHPRRRYTYENIMLWGPQYGEELCQRRYGMDCFTVVVVGGEGWQLKLMRVLKMLRRFLML